MNEQSTQAILTLLKLGLGIQQPDNVSDLLALPMEQWEDLMALAERQGVLAIAVDGLQVLIEAHKGEIIAVKESPAEWQMWLLENIGQLTQYEVMNSQQKKVIAELSEMWAAEGIRMMVFKGQANAALYPKPEHRAVGDIDCYLLNDNHNENTYQRGNEVLRKAGAEIDESWYRHSKISYKGETIENHRVMSHTRGSKAKQAMENDLRFMVHGEGLTIIDGCGKAMMPSPQFNACFLTYHGLHHFLSEGLRMKQILDWAMFLQKEQDKVDWNAYWDFYKRYKLERFASLMTYIATEYLGVETNTNFTNDTNIKVLAEKVMKSTLYDDDYLFNSGKSDWMVRWLLVKNMLSRDRWKYKDVTQESVMKHLWQNAVGFLFDKD